MTPHSHALYLNSHPPNTASRFIRNRGRKGGISAEVAFLVESLVRASVGGSTHKVYLGKCNKWLQFMKKKGRGPWLNLLDKSEVLTLLLEFMACRLFSFNNRQSTVRGYLAAIKFSTSCT